MSNIKNFKNAKVIHKTFGEGVVTKYKDEYLSVVFNSSKTIRNFLYPDAVDKGFLRFADANSNNLSVSEKGRPCLLINTSKVLFCNIAWMIHYNGESEDDIPVNGGSFVDETHEAHEAWNFMPVTVEHVENAEISNENVQVFGFFETKTTNGETRNQVHIEKIGGCSLLSNEDEVEGVLVVWCATSPKGETCVVGWYNNATVLRRYASIELSIDDGNLIDRGYNVFASESDAVLLPVNVRNQTTWKIPRRNSKIGKPYGFFRANVWYGSEESAQDFIKNLITNINSYARDNNRV